MRGFVKYRTIAALPLTALSAVALAQSEPDFSAKPASEATIAAQTTAESALPVETGLDDSFAMRGYLGTRQNPLIRADDGRIVADLNAYVWVDGEPPDTVHPGLWRHMHILRHHGLFQVGDSIWQVRGFDISNLTVTQGETGWIIVDPLLTAEVARAALDLVDEKLGHRPVRAIIYTHSHVDHFGGGGGIVDPADVKAGKIAVIAPEGFLHDATEENVLAGPAMSRRGSYQVNMSIEPGPRGMIGGGVGPIVSLGRLTVIPPNDTISRTGETRTVDGVELEFQMVSGSEAPSEFNILIPAKKTFLIAEIATCSMHNVLTPRGALVRDALRWAQYLTQAIDEYLPRTETLVTSHCWPRFGADNIRHYLTLQRDSYKYIHDQTVRMFNDGMTPDEIAEAIGDLPEAFSDEWSVRGYYGTYKFNARAVYQRYLGAFDGIPAHLDPLPPEERAGKYVAAMGGADLVLVKGRRAIEDGDYRWASDILNQLVFADPDNQLARAALADAYEQLGYQAQAATWRSIYLSGANELRGIKPTSAFVFDEASFSAIPIKLAFDVLASRLVPQAMAGQEGIINFTFTDSGERASVAIANGVLVARPGAHADAPDIALNGPHTMLAALFIKKQPLERFPLIPVHSRTS